MVDWTCKMVWILGVGCLEFDDLYQILTESSIYNIWVVLTGNRTVIIQWWYMGSSPLNWGSTCLGPYPCKAVWQGICPWPLYSSIHALDIHITLCHAECKAATGDATSHLAIPGTDYFFNNIGYDQGATGNLLGQPTPCNRYKINSR